MGRANKMTPARNPRQWFCSPSGVLDGQLAWGAIWKWFSIVNIDVWARDHSFRLDETTASVTMQVLFSFWSNICLCVIYVYTKYIPDKNVLTAGAPYKTLCFILRKITSLFGLVMKVAWLQTSIQKGVIYIYIHASRHACIHGGGRRGEYMCSRWIHAQPHFRQHTVAVQNMCNVLWKTVQCRIRTNLQCMLKL